jgi:hypothetical protein
VAIPNLQPQANLSAQPKEIYIAHQDTHGQWQGGTDNYIGRTQVHAKPCNTGRRIVVATGLGATNGAAVRARNRHLPTAATDGDQILHLNDKYRNPHPYLR